MAPEPPERGCTIYPTPTIRSDLISVATPAMPLGSLTCSIDMSFSCHFPKHLASLHQLRQRQLRHLPPIQDCLHDIRRPQRQPQQPADAGFIDLLGRSDSPCEALTFSTLERRCRARQARLRFIPAGGTGCPSAACRGYQPARAGSSPCPGLNASSARPSASLRPRLGRTVWWWTVSPM